MSKLLLSIFLWCAIVHGGAAQQQVSGVITDAATRQPLPGASIVIKGTRTATVSGFDGGFQINVQNPEAVLVFSFVGFLQKEVKVGGKSVLNVELSPDQKSLDEVIVVGYGKQKKRDITGAVSSISADDINKSLNTTVQQALQGRVAGVDVTQNSGTPGGGVTVNIRGINTINGSNQPLYVLDGLQIDGSSQNVMATINPSDIESIEVLKDASATAIYGSKASNGVILITTKRGKKGTQRVSFQSYYGLQEIPNRMDLMNLREYATYHNERALIFGYGQREAFKSPELLGEGTNWQEELFGQAPMQNYNLSISGGSEKTKYAISAGYFDQDGIAIGSNFKRGNIRLNIENQSTDWLKFGANLMVGRTNQRITVTESNLVFLAMQQTPDIVARNPDGSWGYPTENNSGNYTTNVIAEALSRENDRKQTQILGSIYADINLTKGLVNHAELATDIGYQNGYVFNPTLDLGPYIASNESYGSRWANNNFNWQFRDYLTYTRHLVENDDFSVMFGFESQENNWENLSADRKNFFTNNIHELPIGDASTATNSSGKGSSSLVSYFTRLNYSYGDKYLLTSTIRRDDSSKFGPKYKAGLFPSFALGWRISNEEFFKNSGLAVINNLKLRGGYGEVGNQGWRDFGYGVALNNVRTVWGTGVIPANIANPELRWEASKATNLGIDIGLFNNRIELIADVYKKRTNNLLLDLPLPSYAGTSGAGSVASPLVNLGNLENKGIELTLRTVNLNGDFKWNTSAVFSTNKNKVLNLVNNDAIITRGPVSQTMVGESIGMMYGYVVEGMFNSEADFYKQDAQGNFLMDDSGNRIQVALPKESEATIAPNRTWVGDYKFKDMNEDGVIDEKDRTVIGNPQPKFQYGLTNDFSYKGFDLSIFLQGVYGNDVYNTLRGRFEDPSYQQGLLNTVTNYARIETIDPSLDNADQIIGNVRISNPGTTIARMTTSWGRNSNFRPSNLYVEDGSYLRIKNVTLGYTIPEKFAKKIHLRGVRAYINIQNLHTFTKYSGYDPEVGGASALEFGIEYGRYPTPRIYTFGLNLDL